ncbi:DNA methyltransferase [Planctomycetota bacterium]
MPLSWNEIRNRAYSFVKEWEEETREHAEAKSFWDSFFNVFGISRRRVASFEQHVKKTGDKDGYIDLLWKGILLVEHKSKGKDLKLAHQQAKDYFPGLKDNELPEYILISDFDNFHLYNMESGGSLVADFTIHSLPDNIKLFAFIAGYQATSFKQEDPVNIKAAEQMGILHDQLKAVGYGGHVLENYLVRLLFCLFADDTGIFEKNLFHDFLINHTSEDGSDLGATLSQLFHVLNTPSNKRLKNLPEHYVEFEYINGSLFSEPLPPASFDKEMRQNLLSACELNWAKISPAIFGSLFQSVMDAEKRRYLGAHYTSETNILKVIEPLFLEGLSHEFEKAKNNRKTLEGFHRKLSELRFFDPACGCGNFLVVAYRELRLLELKVLKILYPSGQRHLNIDSIIKVNVDQFYGIEIEEFPAQIAQVAMWLMDHQMNLAVSEAFGVYYQRLPLIKSATIVNDNALTVDWNLICSKDKLSYILGNPPYVGSKLQSEQQRKELSSVTAGIKGAGVLDYVSGWFILAAKFIQNTNIEVAFVSTNSLAQGEQPTLIWRYLYQKLDLKINFAHRSFQWQSAAKGKAAVHCVIIGFSILNSKVKTIYNYEKVNAEPHKIIVKNINQYLVEGSFVDIANRSKPLCPSPRLGVGNKPIDSGNYLFTPEEKEKFLKKEPAAKNYFRRWFGSKEYLHGIERWCLWLGDCPPQKIKAMPLCLDRINRVKEFRKNSKSKPTQKLSETPTRFHIEKFPKHSYLIIPRHSSETRKYIPIGFVNPEIISGDAVIISDSANLFHFGFLSSLMHMSWVRYVAGRIKSDYRYSIGVVYNNFPWPINVKLDKISNVEKAAQTIIECRKSHPGSSLAELYDPLTMPADLVKAHRNLDRAVDKCYRSHKFNNEMQRIKFLFYEYNKLNADLIS